MPTKLDDTGTIDITNLVSALQSSFVTWGTAFIFGAEVAIPGMEWVGLPVIGDLDRALISYILNIISKSVVMESFYLNTAMRKASQAQDYLDAWQAVTQLPENVSDADYAKAEQNEIVAFRNFVSITN